MTADMPTAPTPNTATQEPGAGRSTAVAALTPVCTPQPSGARTEAGRSSGTFTVARSVVTTRRENEDWPKKWPCIVPSPQLSVADPSARAPSAMLSCPQSRQ